MIKVLIVEDSPVVSELLSHILSSDPDIEVLAIAKDGNEACEFVRITKPDVVTMDIIMPNMNGFNATRKIMETNPVPIVIVSASWDPNEVEKSFQAIEAGAVAAIEKPRGLEHPEAYERSYELIQTVKLMSEVKVVKRHAKSVDKAQSIDTSIHIIDDNVAKKADIKMVAIGASTGGPQTLQTILSNISADLCAPVIIVQHIAAGFVTGFIDWLNRTSKVPVQLAINGEEVINGRAYVAPDGFHLTINEKNRVTLSDSERENFVKPSVSFLFRSIADVFGSNAIGVLLTGMGKDGAKELKLMKDKGSITIAQDKESSIVHGMPGEAIKLGAAMHVLSPEKIAIAINSLVHSHSSMVEN